MTKINVLGGSTFTGGTIAGPLTVTTGPLTLSAGQLLLPDGTTAVPALGPASDPDTGFVFIGDGLADWVTNATIRFQYGNTGWTFKSDYLMGWSSAGADSAREVFLERSGSNNLGIATQANGQRLNVITNTTLLTIVAGGLTSTWAGGIPANCIVVGITSRVTVVLPALATNYDVGIGGATTRYTTNASGALYTTAPGTDDGMRTYTGATDVLVTVDANPADNTGRIRLTVHYISLTPPTS